MRHIKIDKNLEIKVNTFCTNLFSERTFLKPIKCLEDFRDNKESPLKIEEKDYVQHIIDEYDRILKAKPSEILILIQEFEAILPYSNFEKGFADKIADKMRYDDLRNREYLDILIQIGINSCTYCNAQLTVVIDLRKIRGGRIERKGNLELDHFYPKSEYPFLCTSFYNLIPCCSNCNKSKSDESVEFYLYKEDDNLEEFIFHVDEDSIDQFKDSREVSDLKIEFNSINGNDSLRDNHQKYFQINEIYNTQKDIAVELINKSEAYSEAYKQSLVNSFNDLFPDRAMINRLLIGNYDKPEDIHKRPLAKFQQDIARQLGLIK